MSRHCFDPERESDTHALPDLELWEDGIYSVTCTKGCGTFDVPSSEVEAESSASGPAARCYCPSCEWQVGTAEKTERRGWFFWFCLPGCMPDSSVFGPYDTEQEALDAARQD